MSEIDNERTQEMEPVAEDAQAKQGWEPYGSASQDDSGDSQPSPTPEEGRKAGASGGSGLGKAAKIALGACIALVAICLIGAFAVVGLTATAAYQAASSYQESVQQLAALQQSGQQDAGSEETEAGTSDEAAEHEHTWETNWVIEKTEAQTHKVEHAATYKDVTEYHTICNDCGEEIDGAAQAHLDSTGHSGYTTNVPVVKQAVDVPAWTETVVDVAESEQLVANGQICTGCGEVRDAS